jgi:hypothetical protein
MNKVKVADLNKICILCYVHIFHMLGFIKITFFCDVTPCTLKMEAESSSETLVMIYQTMQQHQILQHSYLTDKKNQN